MIQIPFYSFNRQSLLVQCLKSACTYYIPQNLVVLGAFIFYKYKQSEKTGEKREYIQNCDDRIDRFLKEKKLDRESVNIKKKNNMYIVSLT